MNLNTILSNKLTVATWALVLWSVFVLVQSLFFKFQGHEETVIIFTTIGQWMTNIGFPPAVSDPFGSVGGYVVGTVELIAAVLLLIPKTRLYGAIVTVCVLTGAIFFHLFTPLGVVRVINAAGDTDGGALFFMACSVWISCILLLSIHFKGSNAQTAAVTSE